MENLMNKVASDLMNFAPQAPAGMEERIQKELNKKKSFWSFSWYTMNVYVVALLGAGVLALVFSNRSETIAVAQSPAPAASEVKAIPAAPAADVNANSHVILNAEKESKSTPIKTTRERTFVQEESSASVMVVENCQTAVIEEAAAIEVAEAVEDQRMPEEIQVPYPKKEVVKAKGRTLKLTRFTGK
jgi:cytoskeletal protein RodZ